MAVTGESQAVPAKREGEQQEKNTLGKRVKAILHLPGHGQGSKRS